VNIHFAVLPPIPTTGLSISDVAELTTRVRDQMLVTLREISVEVVSEDDTEAAGQPGTKTDLPPVEESEPTSTATVDIEASSEDVPDTPSEGSSEAPSVDTSGSRSLRQEGSISEYGETDDEGMVVVGRHH
jgi:lysophosphatidate acyltransferase